MVWIKRFTAGGGTHLGSLYYYPINVRGPTRFELVHSEFSHPKLTIHHDPKLTIYHPKLTGGGNHTKNYQCLT